MKSMFSDASVSMLADKIAVFRSSGLDRGGLELAVATMLLEVATSPSGQGQPTYSALLSALPVLAGSASPDATSDDVLQMRVEAACEGFKPVVTALGDSIIELGALGGLEASLFEDMVGRVSLAMAVGLPVDPATLARR